MPAELNASEQLTQRGEMLLDRHRPQEAEDHFRQALAANPENAEAHFGLARCLAQDSRRPHKALEEIECALALEPNWSGYHAFRALLLSELGRRKRARQAIQGALELAPYDAYVWYCSALIEQAASRWKEMEQAARQAMELAPDDPDHANLLAEALRHQHRDAEANSLLHQSLGRDPEKWDTHSQLGWQLLLTDRPQAEEHFYEALRLNPHSDHARRGMLEAFMGRNWLYQTNRRLASFFSGLVTVNRLLIAIFVFFIITMFFCLFLPVIFVDFIENYGDWLAWGLVLLIFSPLLVVAMAILNSIMGSVMVLADARARLALTPTEKTTAWFVIGLTVFISLVFLRALIFGPLE